MADDARTGLPTLVVGATGGLGGRVVKALRARGKPVRAMAREGSDTGRLQSLGVEVVRGDMMDPPSLRRAMEGVGAVVTTAAGYMKRKKGDSLATVDDRGNKNLVDAAKAAKLERFVFTSILACDQAKDVPHFWQKKVIEDYLEAHEVPFVSLRPGAFIAMEGFDFWADDLKKDRITSIAPGTWTSIHIDDVARCLAMAVDEPRALNKRIDLGMDRPFSGEEAAKVFSRLLGREIHVRQPPWLLVKGAARVAGVFNERYLVDKGLLAAA
jgi:uncharacterized protein YbjT (DUF2867 family)